MKKMIWQMTGCSALVLTISLLLLPAISSAAPGNKGSVYTLNISMNGTIVANGSCKLNQGGNLTVDFGEVKLLAGDNNTMTMQGGYRQPIASAFTCSGDSAGLLQMKLSNVGGTYKDYNGFQVLDTDKGIVGVELLVNDSAQSMGTWFTVNPDSPPKLEAQLVQTSTSNSHNVVSGDTFTASGTLTMAFN